MPIYALDGATPRIHPDAFVAPTASIIGDVVIEEGASVWYGTVIRGDFGSVAVRAGANVQDGSVIHATADQAVEIGAGATIGHLCVLHAATIGAGALIANGAVILDGATIGAGSLVAAGSLVTAGTTIPEGVLAAGSPAEVRKEIEGTRAAWWVQVAAPAYAELAQRHRQHLSELQR